MNTENLLETPSAGTAPFNETESQFTEDNGQRDDAEATEPEENVQRMRSGAGNTPDGFYWGQTGAGKPILKPSQGLIDELTGKCEALFDDREERSAQLKRDSALFRGLNQTLNKLDTALKIQPVIDLAKRLEDDPKPDDIDKQLSLAIKRLDNVNQYMATNMVRAVCQQAQQDFANSVYWAGIHAQNVHQQRENGNEDAAERSLMLFENSRAQFLVAAQILDWCVEQNMKPDINKGVVSAMGLRGWSMSKPQVGANRKAAQQNTTDLLYGNVEV